MREWKCSANVRKVYEELYTLIDPNDPSSDTYLVLIIKSVFPSENERTNENSIWAQSVLETIFDENHLSSKIDTEVVDRWTGTLTDTDAVSVLYSSILQLTINNVKQRFNQGSEKAIEESPEYSPKSMIEDENNEAEEDEDEMLDDY